MIANDGGVFIVFAGTLQITICRQNITGQHLNSTSKPLMRTEIYTSMLLVFAMQGN
jgi:hypothetical protein